MSDDTQSATTDKGLCDLCQREHRNPVRESEFSAKTWTALKGLPFSDMEEWDIQSFDIREATDDDVLTLNDMRKLTLALSATDAASYKLLLESIASADLEMVGKAVQVLNDVRDLQAKMVKLIGKTTGDEPPRAGSKPIMVKLPF